MGGLGGTAGWPRGEVPKRINSIRNHLMSKIWQYKLYTWPQYDALCRVWAGWGQPSLLLTQTRAETEDGAKSWDYGGTQLSRDLETSQHEWRQSLWPGQDVKMTSMTWLSQSLRRSKTWNTQGGGQSNNISGCNVVLDLIRNVFLKACVSLMSVHCFPAGPWPDLKSVRH